MVDAEGMLSRGICELGVHSSAGQSYKHGLAKSQYLVKVHLVPVRSRVTGTESLAVQVWSQAVSIPGSKAISR